MRLVQVREPIRVVQSSGSVVPEAFTWRARQHRIWKVDGVTDELKEQAQGLVNCRIFQIRTHGGLRCSISYDEFRKYWRLETIIPQGGGE